MYIFDYLRSPSGKVVRRREVTDLDQDQWIDWMHFNDAQRTAKNEEEITAAVAQPDLDQEKSGDTFNSRTNGKASPDFSRIFQRVTPPIVSAISFDIYFHP